MSELTITQKIEKELSSKKADEIEVLDVSGCTGESFEGLTEKFSNLKELVANDCGLKSCAGLPHLKNLSKIHLANNAIQDVTALSSLPSLQLIDLSNNGIESVDVIEGLFGCPKLECLMLEGNDVKKTEGMMEMLFSKFPFLVSIDGVNNTNGSTFFENGEEYEEDYDSDASESESDEEIGLEALQRSGELDDDEEDYEPGEDGEEEEGFDEEDECDDEDDEDEESNHVEEKAGKKRKADDVDAAGDAKHSRVSNGKDAE